MRFAAGLLLGLAIGAAAGAGGVYLALRRDPPALSPLPPPPPGPRTGKKPPRRAGRADDPITPSRLNDEAIELSAADLKIAGEGDALRTAPTTLDLASAREPRDLGQDEIDATIAQRSRALVDCITRARGAAPLSGRVTAGVVVGADGRVLKSRIEAPAYLLVHGLGGCARRELEALRFPAAGKETVVTVPFDVAE